MKKVNVNTDIKRIDRGNLIGYQPKFWGIRESDGKSVLVKYDQLFHDSDQNIDYHINNTNAEFFAARIFEHLGVSCQKVTLGIDKNSKRKTCVVIEDFLQEDEELFETDIEDRFSIDSNFSLEDFLEDYLKDISTEFSISESEIEHIKKDLLNQFLVNCFIGNHDMVNNIGIIHNSKNNSYRLAPAYDNARSFSDYLPPSLPIAKIIKDIFNIYPDYVQETYNKIMNMSEKDINKIFGFGNTKYKDYVLDMQKYIKSVYRDSIDVSKKFRTEYASSTPTIPTEPSNIATQNLSHSHTVIEHEHDE